jgi:uncharacterized protein GlcG (DUF336 family)
VIARGMVSVMAGFSLLLASCGSGGSSPATNATPTPTPTVSNPFTPPAAEALTVTDVQKILAQAVTQAQADGHPAVISVVDRVGNVLALFRMTGAPASAHVADAPNGVNLDVQGLDVPAEASAIAKAITGAYLSSSGNAFSSRTASEIVQPQFPPSPGTVGLGSGPLYGVQFSQLPCSDLSQRFGALGTAAMIGPKRSPLGLSADPGGFPLFKNGVVVGGVGVEADGQYTADTNVTVTSLIIDERIALAGTIGYDAPATITADTIYAAGTQLIYTDVATSALGSLSGASWATAAATGALESLLGYTAGPIIAGTAYGSEASGIRAAAPADAPITGAYVLSDGAGNNRYPVKAATDAADVTSPLTAKEVQTILAQAFSVMSEARAAIRNPASSIAQVSISVVDTHGVTLGLVRAPDAPIFGIDVSLQKARTAAFFSNAAAGAQLLANTSPRVPSYVAAVRAFLNNQAALTGTYAFTDRAGGDLSRPTFPDGSVGRPNGPFSVPAAQFNPFATGLQSALIVGNLGQHLAYVTGQSASDTPQRCTTTPDVVAGQNRMQNGIQIFPGSVPIYRGTVLVGGLGVSGDGVNQDDMVSFLGLSQAGTALGTLGNAPASMRADQIVVPLSDGTTAHLNYVICPQSPFINSSTQNVCQGL